MSSLKTRAFVMTLKVHQTIYERSGGLVGHRLLGMPTLLLRTTGRKSGQTRTSALVYAEDGDRRLVCASNGGHHRPPAWLLNLEADSSVEVQVGRRRESTTASAVRSDDPDYERLFALCDQANKGQFSRYRQRTDRDLAVVVLTPR